jgi:ribosomal protein L29
MKKKELTKLREKSVVELEKLVAEKKSIVEGSKSLRRDISQIKTIIKEAKLNENNNR